MLFDIENNEWVYRRNSTIRGSLDSMALESSHGLMYLAPEIQLLYKSKGLRPKDIKDFESTLPALTQDKRSWLKKALQISYPDGHDWISRL